MCFFVLSPCVSVKVLSSATQKLEQVNGGGRELGTSWKENLKDDATFDESIKYTIGSLDQAYGLAIKSRATKVVQAFGETFRWGLHQFQNAMSSVL